MHVPYLDPGTLEIGPLSFRPFMLLMVSGILTAHFAMLRRAGRAGLDAGRMATLSLCMVAAGLAGAALFKLLYHPEHFALPLRELVKHVALASFGGIFGGLAGAIGFSVYSKTSATAAVRYLDTVAFCFPFGWIFGRTGCFLAHEHPGVLSDSWLAVAYPGGARMDFGFLEILLMLGVIALFQLLDRKPRVPGFYLAVFLSVYGVFRAVIDRFHVDPPRYLGIPVDQWAGGAAAVAGIVLALIIGFRQTRATRMSQEELCEN